MSSASSRPTTPPLLGFVSLVAPALCAGNAVVVLASETNPLVAITLARDPRDLGPPRRCRERAHRLQAEIGPWLAGHGDVDTVDVTGAADDLAAEMERAAADDVKRVVRPLGARRRLVERRRRIAVRGDGDDGAQDRLAPEGRCERMSDERMAAGDRVRR